MKNLITLTSLVILLCGSAQGQTFNSGSTGADGAFTVSIAILPNGVVLAIGNMPVGTTHECNFNLVGQCTVTLPLREPPNHVYNFTTVDIDQFVTVKFAPNKANTPVFILASGDVTINGIISVNGEPVGRGLIPPAGGPGGFSGGTMFGAQAQTQLGGAGSGPGGGNGGRTAQAPGGQGLFGPSQVGFLFGGFVYGNPELQPLIGGSGGGGGAILIAASGTINLAGSDGRAAIAASGGLAVSDFSAGGGSGGAIRLVASILKGSRGIRADGGSFISGGNDGRIRIDLTTANQYVGQAIPSPTINSPGEPIVLFPPLMPTLRILSIGGFPLPAQPTAAANTSDIALPAQSLVPGFYPVNVELEATNVPSGTMAKVLVGPQYGAGDRIISPPVALTGSVGQPKRATVQVNLPPSGVGIISALIDSVVPEP